MLILECAGRATLQLHYVELLRAQDDLGIHVICELSEPQYLLDWTANWSCTNHADREVSFLPCLAKPCVPNDIMFSIFLIVFLIRKLWQMTHLLVCHEERMMVHLAYIELRFLNEKRLRKRFGPLVHLMTGASVMHVQLRPSHAFPSKLFSFIMPLFILEWGYWLSVRKKKLIGFLLRLFFFLGCIPYREPF